MRKAYRRSWGVEVFKSKRRFLNIYINLRPWHNMQRIRSAREGYGFEAWPCYHGFWCKARSRCSYSASKTSPRTKSQLKTLKVVPTAAMYTAKNRNIFMSSLINIWNKVFFNATFFNLFNSNFKDLKVFRNEIYASF